MSKEVLVMNMPEFKSGYEDINKTLHREGWNACIDALEGGVNRNEV